MRGVKRTVAALAAAVTLAVPAAAQDEEPITYDAGGVRVVQRVLPGSDVVSVRLYLLGGARQLTEATQGVERFVLRASERGTAGLPGSRTLEEQVATGGVYGVSTGPDWSTISVSGLAEDFERSFAVLAERVVRPTLDAAAVEVTRGQLLTEVRIGDDSPDAVVARLARELAFAGHAYAFETSGTEESLEALDSDALKAYHDQHFTRSRMLVSIVGGVERARAEAAVAEGLSGLPLGSYEWTMPEPWAKPDPDIRANNRSLPTNYILGYFSGPSTRDEDYLAFVVGLRVLGGFVSGMIRSRGLSYAAGAPLVDRAAAGGGIYVSTVRPDETMEIVNEAITALGQVTLRRSDLRDYADDSVMEYYLQNLTSADQADFIARSYLLHGRLDTAESWIEEMRDVSPGDVRRIFHDYVHDIQYGYVGDTRLVPRGRLLWH